MPRMMTILLAVWMMLLAGCQSDEQKQRDAELSISKPLAFDPTEQYELSRWWSNGQQMLRLDEDAKYVIYDSQNRYSQPIERGRWGQMTYAVLRLEPYNTRTPDPRRVSISKIDNKLALMLPKFEPMFALNSPPTVLEDRLIGQWRGVMGILELGSDMRYTLDPAAGVDAAKDSSSLTRPRKGRWSVANNQRLVLHADATTAREKIEIPFTVSEETITLNAEGGPLMKVDDKDGV